MSERKQQGAAAPSAQPEVETEGEQSPLIQRLLADPRTRPAMLRKIEARRQRRQGGEDKPRLETDTSIVEEGDNMMVFGVDEETIQKARTRQIERVAKAEEAGFTALLRFDSILRARAAKVDISKGYQASAEKTVKGWFRDNLQKAWPKLFGAEVEKIIGTSVKVGLKEVPLVGTAMTTLSDGVEGHAKSKQAEASVQATDTIIAAARAQIVQAGQEARARLADPAYARELLGVDAVDPGTPPVTDGDIRDLIAHLDAQLKEAMWKSGSETTSEYLEDLHGRKKLGAEMSAAERKIP